MDEHELRRAVCEEPTAAGLLRAVLEAPDDDTPRLIFADWLEERGEVARAEFIRVQCHIWKRLSEVGIAYMDENRAVPKGQVCDHAPDALLCCYPATARGLKDTWCPYHRAVEREKELFPRCTPPLIEELLPLDLRQRMHSKDGKLPVTLRRGFVESVSLRCEDWLKHGPALVKGAPLREVTLADKKSLRRPLDVTNTASGGGAQEYVVEWQWLTGRETSDETGPYLLPGVLFRLLTSGHPLWPDGPWRGRSYENKSAALADLSRACLAWAADVNNG